jgi:uncharacterized protein (DUF58 family)
MLYPDFNELVGLGRKAFKSYGLSERSVMSAAPGDYTSPFRGQGLDFEEVRRYVPGDDIRNIDWRVTARTGIPHLKVFTQEREHTVLLCIDATAQLRFGTRGTFKSVQAARAAALLGWSASRNHDRVGAIVYGDVPDGMRYFSPARSRRPLWKTLKLLSQPQPAHPRPGSLEDALKYLYKAAPTGAFIFVIGSFETITAELERSFAHLQRRCDIVLLRINDPADQAIPPVGMLRFARWDGLKLRVNTDSGAGRDAYAKQWQETRQEMETIALRLQMGIIDLHTDKDVQGDLVEGLHRLSFRKGGK